MANLTTIETKLDEVLTKINALVKKMDEDEKIFQEIEKKLEAKG